MVSTRRVKKGKPKDKKQLDKQFKKEKSPAAAGSNTEGKGDIKASFEKTKEASEEEEDLNYDEYDLAEECDIRITCKVCSRVFNSLERFISHKKNECTTKRNCMKDKDVVAEQPSAEKPSTDIVVAEKAVTESGVPKIVVREKPAMQSLIKDTMRVETPVVKRPVAEVSILEIEPAVENSAVRKSNRKRKPKMFPSDEMEFPKRVKLEPKCDSPKSGSSDKEGKKRRIVIHQFATPDDPSGVVVATSIVCRTEEAKLTKQDSEESEIDDINDIVSVSYKNLEDDESDDNEEIPIKVSSYNNTTARQPLRKSKSESMTHETKDTSNGVISYAVVKVMEIDNCAATLPTLSLSVEQLKKVNCINLVIPTSMEESFTGFEGIKQKGFLTEEIINPTRPSDPTSALGPLETVLAKSKEGQPIKLYIRKIVKSEYIQYDAVEEVEADNISSAVIEPTAKHAEVVIEEKAQPAAESPTEATELKSSNNAELVTDVDVTIKQDTTEELVGKMDDVDEDVCSDDEIFDHDSSLYAHLRDDAMYTLLPKQQNRLSRTDIRNRSDCDWDKLQCLTCGTMYSCMKTLINHMSYQHSDKKAFYPCVFCGSIYSQHKNVARHIMKTHHKTKDFVDKLRGFLRSQAFTRTFTSQVADPDKLSEENDPFLAKIREKRGHQITTKYCNMTDKEILAKFGRKVKIIGRPPGRPSKVAQKALIYTCTKCNKQLTALKMILNHLKADHQYPQRKINAIKLGLQTRVHNFQSEELKKVEKSPKLNSQRQTIKTLHSKHNAQSSRSNQVENKMISTLKTAQVETITNQKEQVMSSVAVINPSQRNPATTKPLEISGLNTLAEISTSEASKASITQPSLLPAQSQATLLSNASVQRVPPVITLTADQLEQIRKSGNPIIYILNQ